MMHAGILAHSPDGAALAFTAFCHAGQDHFGSPIHPDITMDYIAMGETLKAWEKNDLQSIRAVLEKSIKRLESAGAKYFFCPDNTAHIALEAEGMRLALPGLNLPNVVAERAATLKFRKLGVLGTKFSMDGPSYEQALRARGIICETPTPSACDYVHKAIFRELVRGVFRDDTRKNFLKIIAQLATSGCDGIALACTEIPLLISQADTDIPLLDSTRLLSLSAFNVGIGLEKFPSWRGGPPCYD